MEYLTRAIQSLKPTAEFSFTDNDYSTIKWDVLDGDAPTKKEVEDEIVRIKAVEVTEAQTQATAKVALLKKLGITQAEADLLLA